MYVEIVMYMFYLFDADELDLLRSSLELPLRKLEVLEPTYRDGVTRLLSEKKFFLHQCSGYFKVWDKKNETHSKFGQ